MQAMGRPAIEATAWVYGTLSTMCPKAVSPCKWELPTTAVAAKWLLTSISRSTATASAGSCVRLRKAFTT